MRNVTEGCKRSAGCWFPHRIVPPSAKNERESFSKCRAGRRLPRTSPHPGRLSSWTQEELETLQIPSGQLSKHPVTVCSVFQPAACQRRATETASRQGHESISVHTAHSFPSMLQSYSSYTYYPNSTDNYGYHGDYGFTDDYGYPDDNKLGSGDRSGSPCPVAPSMAARPMRAVLYCVVILLGVPGNMTLLGALWDRGRGGPPGSRHRKWRTSEILAANLAVSDLLFLGSLPLWIDSEANGGAWRAGGLSCKAVSYVTALTMYAGIWFITFMSIDRYLAVVRPTLYRHLRRHLLVVSSCLLTWLSAALLATLLLRSRVLLKYGSGGTSYCTDGYEQPAALTLCLVLLTFFLPLSITLFCYGALVRMLHLHSRGPAFSPTPLRRSMRAVLWLVAIFILSWLPFNVCKLLRAVSRCLPPGATSCSLEQVGVGGMEWTAPLAFANSCVNPLVFGTVGRALLRRGLGALCLSIWREGTWRQAGGASGASSQMSPSTWDGGIEVERGGRGASEEKGAGTK
ncbi:G-protein coupled receptor 15-like [Arapaima gigas]